ncbi:MAG: hypothetical protein H6754_01060 [Candidatus Omnitrophica bacterium]|nr:hypothetical protein [Candidatus Omnitrophota bacterium]
MSIEDIKDVRPPVDLPVSYFLLYLALGILAVIAVALLLRWWFKKINAKKITKVIVKAPWEIAQEELAKLQSDDLPSRGEIKEYFIRLSGIVRHYLERRFSLSAPEMTTDEFLFYIKTISVLDQQQKESLREFLTASDMVKFARYGSSQTEMTNAFNVAKRLVEETTLTPLRVP